MSDGYKEWRREICGQFPGGYQVCTIIGQDKPTDPDWLKFRTDSGRIAWAKFRLGHCCETEPTKYNHPAGWEPPVSFFPMVIHYDDREEPEEVMAPQDIRPGIKFGVLKTADE